MIRRNWLSAAVTIEIGVVATFSSATAQPLNVTAGRADYATWPSVAVVAGDTQWVAWQEYNADQDANKLWARPVVNGVPGSVLSLTPGWGQYLGPKVAIDGRARAWFVWPGESNGNWDLWARYHDGNTLSDPIRVTNEPKPEYHQALAVDHAGRLWIAYEDFNGAKVAVRAKVRDGETWSQPYTLSHVDSNGYSPSIAVDDANRIWVVWYSFREGSYDVYARTIVNDVLSTITRISQTTGFDEYPVVAPAVEGGVWIAWRNGQMAGGRIDLYGFTWYKEIFIRRADGAFLSPVVQVPPTDLMLDSQIHGPTPFALARAGDKILLYARQPDTATLGPEANRWAIRGLLFDGSRWSQAFALSAKAIGYHQPMGVATSPDGSAVSVAWQTDDRVVGDLFNAHSDIWLDSQPVAGLGSVTRNSLSPRANAEWPRYDTHVAPRRTIRYEGKDYNVYFGDLHLHTDNSLDGQSRNGMYDTNLRRIRDLTRMDFAALTDHGFYMNFNDWNESRKWTDIYNQLGDFTVFEAWEWTQIPSVVPEGYGHRNVVYRGSGNTFYSRNEVLYPTTLWSLLAAGDAVTIPHHPASEVHPMDWDYHSDVFQRLVEIFQIRGNMEYHDAPRVGPDSIQPGPGEPEPPGYVHPALARGHRFGLIASPDHQGYAGEAAVLAPANNRDDVMDAMLARRTYAVTNSKIFCDVRVDGHLMGEEYQRTAGPVEIDVHLIAGPGFGPIYQVDVFRVDTGGDIGGDAIIYTQSPNANEVVFTFTDTDPPVVDCAYYVRALQTGTSSGRPEMLWTSPVFALYDTPAVSVDLGSVDDEQGLRRVDGVGDGDTVAETIGGRDARRNQDPGQDYYVYFDVDDLFAFRGNRPEVAIKIDYYDAGAGSLTLQYDASDGTAYKGGGSVRLTGTNTWQQHVYTITDAYFGNRQNGGADFRIFGGVGRIFHLDVVTVSGESLLPWPAGHPQPAHHEMDVSTTTVLSWSGANRAVSYDVYFDTAEPPILKRNQTETVFDPGRLATLTRYYWRIDSVNAFGTTTGGVWSFVTAPSPGDFDRDNDVDQADFGIFQVCYSGAATPLKPGCEDVDLNADNAVGPSDFGIFQACLSGANVPAAPGCAE